MSEKVQRTDEEWKAVLTPEEYRVLRKGGTEMPFTGKLLDNKGKGTYVCAGCGNELFMSDAKFDSGTGWPSFCAPASSDSLQHKEDRTMFLTRTELLCKKCGGHLGHVFDDGPEPTRRRYCINSSALHFIKSGNKKETTDESQRT